MKKKTNRPTGKRLHILIILLNGEVPSTMELVERCHTTRPGSGIHYLRNNFQMPIETEMVIQVNNKGEKTRFAKYRITPTEIKSQRERFGFSE